MDRKALVGCLSAALLLMGTLSCSRQKAIVVGSKNFTEQVVLGEILAQQIERRLGVPVIRKLDLGGTLLAHEALTGGSIDLYPEYTGTALTAVLKRPAMADANAVFDAVRDAYHRQWELAWIPPLGFINTFAMVVRRDAGASTLSEAAGAQAWRLGMGYEFRQRPDGLDGLLKAYRLRLQGDPVTMDLGLLYAALQGRKVDMIAANSTDGLLSVLDVKTLADDRHYFPPYQCAVIVREATLAQFPGLRAALAQLSGKITESVMRDLNYQLDGKHRRAADVAQEFLRRLPAQ
ncbi:MAG TPA: glycine betaine ABC transporter substrate-binding protein [Bryobacteraceae bacterium]|nr:glycine betaine ABC transporter substrate-binding protein [Bryobacteraceae bacterium]